MTILFIIFTICFAVFLIYTCFPTKRNIANKEKDREYLTTLEAEEEALYEKQRVQDEIDMHFSISKFGPKKAKKLIMTLFWISFILFALIMTIATL